MRTAWLVCGVLLTSALAAAAEGRFKKVIFGRHSDSLESFSSFARQAKQAGATHIVITAEDLPWAMWQMDTPGDPYPA
jgi:dihydrodipicolinate synthase/N-acetylneuraminate lyase